ncbi:MAG: D-alanine--D-serine ligase VanG [Erysipelotrichaceae bacterium]|nr:D-alanine--D-serine ligase VanG [Erysipelotrichaceae bacterium]
MSFIKIAVIFGGASPEYSVSLQSAHAIMTHLDHNRYELLPIGITKQGEWYYYTGHLDHLLDDTWHQNDQELHSVMISFASNHRGFMLDNHQHLDVDLVFPVLHGENGEDGTVQGMIKLTGLPVVGCGVLSSALCMDKERAHKLVSLEGIRVPRSVTFKKHQTLSVNDLSYPLFVKPVHAGSSFGITKIMKHEELKEAAEKAFQYDDEIIIEEAIEGFEVGCAILGCDELITGRVDEIELSQGFFDFTEKYTLKSSKIHMPARIDQDTEKRIQETAKTIYKALDCSGFARVDMFYTPEGDIVFNEVNTIPGFTSHSRYPNMMKGAGLSFEQIIDTLIGLYSHYAS